MVGPIDFAIDVQKRLERGEAVFDGSFFLQPARDFEWEDDSPFEGLLEFFDRHERLASVLEFLGMSAVISLLVSSLFFRPL